MTADNIFCSCPCLIDTMPVSVRRFVFSGDSDNDDALELEVVFNEQPLRDFLAERLNKRVSVESSGMTNPLLLKLESVAVMRQSADDGGLLFAQLTLRR